MPKDLLLQPMPPAVTSAKHFERRAVILLHPFIALSQEQADGSRHPVELVNF